MEGFGTALAASITGLSVRQVDYLDRRGIIKPGVRQAAGYGSARCYSFANLVELRTVKHLRDQGLSLQKVRKCLAFLKKYWSGCENALKKKALCTDGKTVYLRDRQGLWDLLDGGQAVIAVSIGATWAEVEQRVGETAGARLHTVKVGGRPYRVVIFPDREAGGFVADCPALLGCMSQGETVAEALANIKDAMLGWLAVELAKRKAAAAKRAG